MIWQVNVHGPAPNLPPARHRQRMIFAAGHEHDARAPKHRQTQARRLLPALHIPVPQLAEEVEAAG